MKGQYLHIIWANLPVLCADTLDYLHIFGLFYVQIPPWGSDASPIWGYSAPQARKL